MKSLIQFIKGFVIGAGVIIPGVSGGVLAILLNMYEDIVEKTSHFFKKPKENAKFLLPVFSGIFLGIFAFGNVLFYVFEQYEDIAKFVFSGIVIGSIPYLFQKTQGMKKLNIAVFLSISMLMSTLMVMHNYGLLQDPNQSSGITSNSYLLFVIMGFLYISGKIIPGLSSSVMLILIGQYNYFLYILANIFSLNSVDYVNLMFIILGMIIGGIIIVKLVAWSFKKYYYITYSVIIAFVISSVVALIPSYAFDLKYGMGLITMIVTALLSYRLLNRK